MPQQRGVRRLSVFLLGSGLTVCGLMICGLTGCGASTTPTAAVNDPFPLPAEVQEAGTTWTLQNSLPTEDQAALERLFREQPSLGEGPLVRGEPGVYREGQRRRFVWARQWNGQGEWLWVEATGNKWTVHEGRGSTFSWQSP